MRHARRFVAPLVAAGLLLAPAAGPRAEDPAIARMVRPIIDARSVTARVLLDRSDPFGSPPARSTGRPWSQPGRGLKVRFDRGGGEEIVADRSRGAFFLYRPAEKTVYRAAWERAPSRLRRIVEEPSRILDADLRARPERRTIGGAPRDGYRLRDTALGDSTAKVSFWIAGDPRTGLLRWIAMAAPEDSVWIELRGLALGGAARDRDLALSAPRGTPVEPMDPREMLRDGEGR